MKEITYGQIRIDGGIEFSELRDLEIQMEPNQHATAILKGIVEDINCPDSWESWTREQIIKIYFRDEEGKWTTQPIFSGYLSGVTAEHVDGVTMVRLSFISGTILLDQKRICRSYQDIGMSYADIVENAIHTTNRAACICSVGNHSFPQKPIIQYQETQWEFIKRMASSFESSIYPEVSQPYPRFWFGFPEVHKTVALPKQEYIVGISEHFFALGGSFAGYDKSDFIYYELSCLQNFDLSMEISFCGQRYRIGKKKVSYVNSEIIFTYLLCKPIQVALKKYDNSHLTGMSLLGTVLSTANETLKIHLDIDEVQDEATAYAYEWTPDTGSVMYCMPQLGTKVSLYFAEESEQSARVINCVRTNGSENKVEENKSIAKPMLNSVKLKESGDKAAALPSSQSGSESSMSNPNNRGLSTEHGKMLFLNSESIGFSESNVGNFLNLDDEIAVTLETSHKVMILSEGTTKILGKNVTIETPVEVNLARRGADG